MAKRSIDAIRAAVSAAYGAGASAVSAGEAAITCEGDSCTIDAHGAGVKDRLYAVEQTEALPQTVVSYGCGNPVAIGTLRPGEVVLDLGSGAGRD